MTAAAANGKPLTVEGLCQPEGGGKPHPVYVRPGPQAFNQIAATFDEQLARARSARTPRPYAGKVAARLVATAADDEALQAALVPWPLVKKLVEVQVADAVAQLRAEMIDTLKALLRRRTA
jgi:hypothetical protein